MLVTDNNFDSVISENNKILVDFWASWCVPCQRLAPILEEIQQENNLLVGKLNIDENPVKTEEFSVVSVPTMVLFIDGVPVHRVTGAMPKHKLVQEFAQWI